MIVVDASVAVTALLRKGPARQVLQTEHANVPHLADAEVAHVLRRRTLAGELPVEVASQALDTWGRLGIARHPMLEGLARVWELRANLTAYDASYVALAERLGCALLTADARLAGAPGLLCPVTVLPG